MSEDVESGEFQSGEDQVSVGIGHGSLIGVLEHVRVL